VYTGPNFLFVPSGGKQSIIAGAADADADIVAIVMALMLLRGRHSHAHALFCFSRAHSTDGRCTSVIM